MVRALNLTWTIRLLAQSARRSQIVDKTLLTEATVGGAADVRRRAVAVLRPVLAGTIFGTGRRHGITSRASVAVLLTAGRFGDRGARLFATVLRAARGLAPLLGIPLGACVAVLLCRRLLLVALSFADRLGFASGL